MTSSELLQTYPEIKEPFFSKRRFKHEDLVNLLKRIPFDQQIIGYSYEGRSIHKIQWGKGGKTVLLWSQMHGNEATATMALFDIFRFLQNTDSSFTRLLHEKLSLHFVPMLNPDGAERFIRRTAQQIDMNRDALALACPESKLLKKLQDDLQPEVSFNLHDQDPRWAAGHTGNQASMAFLATAYDKDCNWNENRTRSMQVICEMNEVLKPIIPHRIGRFSDEFEPRAFGDNIQKWGSSLILIESGGNGDDREKMELRQLNFLTILKALESIASESYTNRKLQEYESIPLNTKCLFDLLIRNVKLGDTLLDLGINLNEINNENATDFHLDSSIEDMGDLSTFFGIKTLDAAGMDAQPLEQFSETLTEQGLSFEASGDICFEKRANFALTKNGKPQYFVINGILHPSS